MKRPSIFLKRGFIVFIAALIGFSHAWADDDAERESLANIAYELQRLQDAVTETGKHAQTTTRVQFHYDWLAKDLEIIRQGIEDHLDRPRQPRSIPPLRGDYRQ